MMDETTSVLYLFGGVVVGAVSASLIVAMLATIRMVQEERKRFDSPDHSGDANKMVEPREWVDLTEAEITQIVAGYYATYEDLVRLTQDRLRAKNGGTR